MMCIICTNKYLTVNAKTNHSYETEFVCCLFTPLKTHWFLHFALQVILQFNAWVLKHMSLYHCFYQQSLLLTGNKKLGTVKSYERPMYDKVIGAELLQVFHMNALQHVIWFRYMMIPSKEESFAEFILFYPIGPNNFKHTRPKVWATRDSSNI